jgi:hypothetical protein
LSLAILIHVVRQQFSLFRKLHWPYYEFSRVLEAASKFDVLDTSPELQHEFCALWNEVCASADWEIARHILSPIRNIYLTLHLHTDSVPTAFSADTGDNDQILWQASVYPSCNVPDHQLHSTPLIHDIAAPTAIVHGVPRNDALLVPTSLTTAPAAPSPSIHAPILIDEHTMDMPPLDSDMSAPVPFHPAHQMTTESVRASSTSPDPAGASAALNNPSAQTMSLTTRETLMSTSSVVPPAPLSPQHIADLLVHPDEPEVPSSAFPEPVLDDSTDTSPKPTSAPELDTSEGTSTKAGLREDKGALDTPSVNRANTSTVLDHPPQPPSQSSATDMAISGPSQEELNAEHTGDPHSHKLHC